MSDFMKDFKPPKEVYKNAEECRKEKLSDAYNLGAKLFLKLVSSKMSMRLTIISILWLVISGIMFNVHLVLKLF